MNKTYWRILVLASLAALFLQPVSAVVIDFTGGTVVRFNGPNQTTDNTTMWGDVDYYEEGGFKIDIIEYNLGTGQVGADFDDFGLNDVIKFGWFSSVTRLVVSKMDGSTFDLNSFNLVSNLMLYLDENDQPIYAADTYIKAVGGADDGYTQLLPVEYWGFPGQQVNLGSEFHGITSFEFYSVQHPSEFSIDDLYIDELPSNAVADSGSTLVLVGLALVGLALLRHRRI